MATTFGNNMKVTAPISERARVARVFEGVLGARAIHPRPELDVFVLEDGFSIGFYFMEHALTEEQAMLAPWIELVVDDVSSVEQKLAELGVLPFEYEDRSHAYFQSPGGLVFRLARR
jgi:hypothetical protein